MSKRGRTSYSKLMKETVWGAYDFDTGNLNGTCKAESQEAAWKVFDEHNKRNPNFQIHGEIKVVE